MEADPLPSEPSGNGWWNPAETGLRRGRVGINELAALRNNSDF